MSDMIASARNMTVVAEGQYNTVGMPKGGLTPATITAMVGFKQGKGLEADYRVQVAIDMLNAADANVYPTASTTASRLETFKNKVLAGGPAVFMQKFNTARAHINDSIELKKVTAFTSNQSLSGFGKGISSMSDLTDNGISGSLGDLSQVGDVFSSAGPLFDMKDMKNFGTPTGLINKLSSTKMANATGVNAELAKSGVDVNDLDNPVYKDSINKAMANIKDPKVLNAVSEQFGVNPAAGLPNSLNNSLTDGLVSASKANPFGNLPSQAPADPNAAANLLGGRPATGNPTADWATVNSPTAFGTAKTPTVSGYTSKTPTAFGSASTEGQEGTGVAGLKGTPFAGLIPGGNK
jgi:hypothetical protein